MDTLKCHYSYKGERRAILLALFARFCRFSKGAFCRKSPISTARNSRLKSGKLLNVIGLIGTKTRQFSISLL